MEDLMNLFRQFKLGNSVFTTQQSFSSVEYEMMPYAHKQMVKQKFVEKAASYIIDKHQSSITENNTNNGCVEFRCELMVLKVQDFKSIVEAAIQMMPMAAIEKIRNGETITSIPKN